MATVRGHRRRRAQRADADHRGRARFEAIVEQGSDLIALSDPDGTITYLSPGHYDLIGSTRQTMTPDEFMQFIHRSDLPALESLLARAARDGRAGPADTRIRAADGTWHTIETTATDLTAVSDVESIVWIGRDVTERRALERELASAAAEATRREAALAYAQRLARLGTWQWQVGADSVSIAADLAELLGLGQTLELTTADLFDRVHPHDRDLLDRAMMAVADSGHPTSLDVRVVIDATTYWLHITAERMRLADGELVVSGTAQDVTARRRVEDELRRSEQRFRAVAETACDAIVTVDADGAILTFNAAAEQMFGRSAADAIGQPLASLLPARLRAEHAASFTAAPTEPPSPVGTTMALTGRRGDGTEFPIEMSLAHWQIDGEWFGTSIIRDVTERERAAAEIRAANSLLNATLESTGDGILVTDLDNNIVITNRRFAELLRLPDSVIAGGDAAAAAQLVLDQLEEPDTVLAQIEASRQHRETPTFDTLACKDGRVFERGYRPLHMDDEIVGSVWTIRDVTERARLEAQLAHQAFHDSLTGLANHALFVDRVEHALQRRVRTGNHVAVLFIDLDDFKTVNDSLGHSAGDELLVQVSQRLRDGVRSEDTIARLGGDEFAMLVEAGADDAAIEIAERTIGLLVHPFSVAGKDINISASIGIAFAGEDATADQLHRNADLAMYDAKALGKGCYQLFEPEMHRAALERLELDADLRLACERDELLVHYQPIVRLTSGRVAGVEALVRWDHPRRGLLQPDDFIPCAENNGLINHIGNHVLRVACGQVRQWQVDHPDYADLTLSVNLSPRQLLDPNLVDRVRTALDDAGLDHRHLTLEITEGAIMANTQAAIAQLAALKTLGVGLAVDDFGIGHSSLRYLQQFPIDCLKIDKSFVADLEGGPEDSALARAIARLAHTLHLTAVAEGVESAGQARRLRELGCDLAQGFYFSRPIAADELTVLLVSDAFASAYAASDGAGGR